MNNSIVKSSNDDSLLRIKNVSKSFNGFLALKEINLDIKAGEFITLLGPSGCGKTTLLRLIAGFESPCFGDIYYNNKNITMLSPQLRPVHTVFQNYALFPHMNVFDNVAFSLQTKKHSHQEDIKKRVRDVLAMVRLEGLERRSPSSLSGGQQQRVAIARAIADKPAILLLDECLSALDYRLRKSMQVELKQLQRELNITFIFVTHSQEEALSLSDRIVVLDNGGIAQIGTAKEVYEEPNSLYVAKFIGEANVFDVTITRATQSEIFLELEHQNISLKNTKNFQANDNIHLIIRPEDVYILHEPDKLKHKNTIPAICEEVIYKGPTVELLLRLRSGKHIYASEFFNEDDIERSYRLGEEVWIYWLPGWEVVLPYEA